MIIPFTKISAASRARNEKKYGDLRPTAESISSVGLIHPIVLSHRPLDDCYDLVAGGRRFECFELLGHTEVHHGVTLDPKKPGFVFASEVPEHIRKEAELDENLHRLGMDWVDTVLLISDIHATKKNHDPKWGYRQTAEVLGKGFGKSSVNNAVRVAKLLRAGDAEILKCANMMDAMAVLIKRKEDEALAEMQRRVTPSGAPTATPVLGKTPSSTSSFLDTLNIVLSPNRGMAQAAMAAETEKAKLDAERPPAVVPLSSMFTIGDFRTVMPTIADGAFSHVVTDIPYGIDMENMDEKMVSSVKAEHDVDQNIDLMEPFLREAFRVIAPGGFCIFFYDLDHHEKLQTWAKDVGFRVQRWPFIAAKTSACQNNAAQYNTTKNYEPFMLLRKDGHTVLRKPCNTSWKTYNFHAERELYANPFAKPFELWKDIYDMIAFPGRDHP